jgi:uncharacterized protein DUF1801
MAQPKTTRNNASVGGFLNSIKDDQVRKDCWAIVDIMQKATKAKPKMWGASIVGFGTYRCTYANGREADWMVTAFSPRKQNITVYLMGGFERYGELMATVGKHTRGKSCLHIKRLSDVHLPTLKKLVNASVKHVIKTNLPDKRQ